MYTCNRLVLNSGNKSVGKEWCYVYKLYHGIDINAFQLTGMTIKIILAFIVKGDSVGLFMSANKDTNRTITVEGENEKNATETV